MIKFRTLARCRLSIIINKKRFGIVKRIVRKLIFYRYKWSKLKSKYLSELN